MIKQYRYPLSTHFYINPFKLLRRSYVIRQEWIDKTLIINWFPSTFCRSWAIIKCVYIAKEV